MINNEAYGFQDKNPFIWEPSFILSWKLAKIYEIKQSLLF